MNWRERGWEFGIGAVIVLCVGITLQRRYHSPAESPPKPTPTTPSARPAAASEPGTAPPSLPSPPRPASLPIIEEIRHVCQMLRQERITAKQTLKLMGTTQEKPKPGKVVPFQPTNPLFDEGHVSCSFESRAPDAVALVLKDPQMLRLSDLRAVFGQDYVISPQHPDGPFFFEFLRNPHPEPIECILLARALLDFSMPEVEEARAREKAGIREFMIEDIDWPVQSLTMRRDALSD